MESKSFRMAVITLIAIFMVFTVAVAVYLIKGGEVPYVREIIAALLTSLGLNTGRNVIVDKPIREAEAKAIIAQQPAPPPTTTSFVPPTIPPTLPPSER